MAEIRKSTIVSGLLWKFAERILAQLVGFALSIVLARILDPSAYGLIAIVNVFTAITSVFVTSGFSTSLIQSQRVDEMDFCSIFWAAMFVSSIIYAGMFFISPCIASFYKEPCLTSIIRVCSLILFIGAFNSIQGAYVSRHMQFRLFFFASLFGSLGSGAIGIVMAMLGCGVWSLVAQSLANSLINTAVLFFFVPWKPRLLFSMESAKNLMGYGWKILASDLFGTIYNNLRTLILGKVYTTSDLAFYSRGQSFPDLLSTNISSTLSAVLFPALSKISDDMDAMKIAFGRILKCVSFVVFPVMTMLIVVARPLVTVLLTDKWIDCVPFIQIIAVARMMDIVPSQNLQVIRALGRSDIALKLEFIKKPLCLIVTLVSCMFGIEAVAFSWVVCAFIEVLVDVYPNRLLIGYGYRAQAADCLPALLLSLVMGASMLFIGIMPLSPLCLLFLEVIVGAVVYLGLSYAFRLSAFLELLTVLWGALGRTE